MASQGDIAGDARVAYGPAAQRPPAAEMGDKALWVDPGAGHALYQVQSGNWVQIGTGTAPPAAPAGVPVLHGPYVVDHTDLAHDGATVTLWTPQAADVLLALWDDAPSTIALSAGTIDLGTAAAPAELASAVSSLSLTLSMASGGPPYRVTASDPLQVRLTLPNPHAGDWWNAQGADGFADAPGGFGQALSLSALGADDNTGIVVLDRVLETTAGGDYTVEVRVRTASASEQVALCFSTQSDDGTSETPGYTLGTDSAGHARATLSGDLADITTAVSLADDAWHSLALVVVGGADAALYVDGVSVGVSSGTAWRTTPQWDRALGGHPSDSPSLKWTGQLDEVAVSHVAQYSATYTPAAAPFAADRAGQTALYHLDGDLSQAVPAPPPTAGHVELYALVARAVTP